MYHVEVGCGDLGVVHAEGAEGDLWGDAQTGLLSPQPAWACPMSNALFSNLKSGTFGWKR